MKNKILILPLLLILLVFGCKNTLIQTEDITSEQYGSLIIGDKTESRALKIEKIEGVKVSVSGYGFSDLSTTTLIKDGAITGVTINGIPVGKNRVVTVHAGTKGAGLTDADLMSGVVMRAVTDINAGANSVTVNWSTTALGNIFYELLKLNYDISEITAEQKSSLVNAIPIPTSVHATLVNAKSIAEDFKNEDLQDSSAYALTGGTVKFDVDVTDYNDYIVQVTDPASSKLIPVSAGKVTGITPGTWDLVVWSNNNFEWCRASQITVTEGAEVELGTLEFVTPKPIFTPASCFFTDSLKISIAAEDGATVYYTTDDSEPTLYTVPFTITENTTVKAFAKIEGLEKSAIVTEEYNKASLGYRYPAEGPYSAVDMNGDADGNGWNTLVSEPGVTINDDGTVTFAVYSANAERILLEIYEEAYGENADAKYDYWMEKGSDDYWIAKVAGVQSGTLYGFRAWGPNWPYNEEWTRGNSNAGYISDYDAQGNRFNPNKVLFDPYAKEISHDKSHPAVLGMVTGGTGSDGKDNPSVIYSTGETNKVNGNPSREFDTGKYAPKAVVIDDSTSFGVKPQIPQEKAIIYEAHARGITKHPSVANLSSILAGIDGFENITLEAIPDNERGTYAGAAKLAPYLKALGVNTIELLPVHESDNDCNPVDGPGGNYWAYMTYGYFAPDRRYSSDKSLGGPTREFKEMVKAFHDEGMEVYLDVVFNHSGEGGTWYGNTDDFKTAELTFMRGLDNSTYYSLVPDTIGAYWENTGCGNNLQCDNGTVRNLILDSLTYWIDKMGVDGYRFDLAPVLGREGKGSWKFNQSAETITKIAELGNLRDVEMIAEAWDCNADDSYQVGNFPAGWGEWNGRYRDAMRNFVGNGNRGSVNDFINGDYHNFNDQGGPHKSVNFIVAHDGFTLADLSSGYGIAGNPYNSTMTWPFGPSDGGNDAGAPSGFLGSFAEGDAQTAAKRQTNRNYIAIQMMSRGVPMIVWGDEFSRTQNGNNNPYTVDSVATWSNYNMINTASPHEVSTGYPEGYHNNFGTFNNKKDVTDPGVNGNFMFMKYMLNLKANEPALNQSNYSVGYDFKQEDGKTDLTDGDRCVWVRINGSGVTGTDSEGNTVQGSDYLVFMNMYEQQKTFTLPKDNGEIWSLIADTQSYFETNFNYWNENNVMSDSSYGVKPWSVVILKNIGKGTTSTPMIEYETDYDTYSMEITLSSTTAGAEIYYTTDGSIPSKSTGIKYTGSFFVNELSSPKTVKAIAYKEGYNESSVASKTLQIFDYTVTNIPQTWIDKHDIIFWVWDEDLGNSRVEIPTITGTTGKFRTDKSASHLIVCRVKNGTSDEYIGSSVWPAPESQSPNIEFVGTSADCPTHSEKTIYCKPQSDWDNVSAYIWKGDGDSAVKLSEWPGVAMSSDGDGWYSLTFDDFYGYENVIFTDGKESGEKTVDLTLNLSSPYFVMFTNIDDGEWVTSKNDAGNVTDPNPLTFYVSKPDWNPEISNIYISIGNNGYNWEELEMVKCETPSWYKYVATKITNINDSTVYQIRLKQGGAMKYQANSSGNDATITAPNGFVVVDLVTHMDWINDKFYSTKITTPDSDPEY